MVMEASHGRHKVVMLMDHVEGGRLKEEAID
jgi:hypothetical protein